MAVRRAGGTGEVVLPADYAASHVDLAYATAAHRGQGRTVDTAHAMVSPTTTREVLYVAATRGRESNQLHVDTSYEPEPQTSHDGMTAPQTAGEVLAAVLANEGADLQRSPFFTHRRPVSSRRLLARVMTSSPTPTRCPSAIASPSSATVPAATRSALARRFRSATVAVSAAIMRLVRAASTSAFHAW